MTNKRDSRRQPPPLTVVGPGARDAALRLLAEKGVVPTARRPIDRRPGDGMTGLGAGPPHTGPAPEVVHQPGGDVVTGKLKHPAFSTVERLYRTLPEEAWFDPNLNPNKPFVFELGAFEVPFGQQFWFTDYSFAVLRFSGVDAGDFLYAEEGRFSGVLGFDVTASTKRMGDLAYQLDPVPLSLTRAQFRPPGTDFSPFGRFETPPDVFDAAAAQSFASTAGPGNSLLPVRPNVQGPRDGPFTYVIQEGQYVALACTIFRPLTTPIAAIEGRLAGFLLHTNLSEALINRLRPR